MNNKGILMAGKFSRHFLDSIALFQTEIESETYSLYQHHTVLMEFSHQPCILAMQVKGRAPLIVVLRDAS